MRYLLGIDFGGGASKATLLAENGTVVCDNTVEYPTYYPEAGACEQAAADWLSALAENTHAILIKSGIDPADIAGVAIDAATHTFLPCDSEKKPLGNAIHWTDTRSRLEADSLRREHGDEIFARTYHKPDTIWTLPQLVWLRKARPDTFSKMRYLFFEKDYVRYFLTGVFSTDYIEAEGSMLFDPRARRWDPVLCALAGIDPAILPPVSRPTDIVGGITEEAAAATGLLPGTPVVTGTTDTAMEVFASGAAAAGNMTVKLATAGRICVITEAPCPDRHIINYSHIIDGLYYPGTATKSAAASYRWYRDTFGGEYAALDKDAAAVPIGCDGLIFLPHLNGELTPYADPQLSGSFTGIRATHTRAHFTRAVLEGVAFSLLDCLAYLEELHIPHDAVATLIGGGAKGRLWREIAADTLGITLRTVENSDSSLGSAMLAGIATGIFSDAKEAISLTVKEKDVVYPDPERTAAYHEVFRRYKALHTALAPLYHGDEA